MRFFIYVLLLLPTTLLSQNGFVKTYSYYDAKYLQFNNIILPSTDTLVVSGQTRDVTGNSYHGIYLAKLDTLGNILTEKVIVPDDDFYIHEAQYGLLKDSEGGYAIVGQYFFQQNGVLIKTDDNFNVEYIKEFVEDPEVIRNIRNEEIIELGGYYYIMARKQHASDSREHSHLMKVTKEGELAWEKNWEEDGVRARFHIENHPNGKDILIYGTKIYLNDPNGLVTKWFAILNDEGEIQYETETELGEFENINYTTFYIDEDDIISAGATVEIIETPSFRYFAQPNVQKIDESINQEWIFPYAEKVEGWTIEFRDIDRCPDGNFVSPIVYPFPSIEIDQQPNILIKYNSYGQKIWERRDTLFNGIIGFFNQANRSVVLPSGSIITCGIAYQRDSIEQRDHAYLIKVDKNGCIEDDCPEIMTSTQNIDFIEKFDLSISPNPSMDLVKIQANTTIDRIDIYTIQGRKIKSMICNSKELHIDINNYQKGLYIFRLSIEDQIITKNIIKM